jgi:hypothetical protein
MSREDFFPPVETSDHSESSPELDELDIVVNEFTWVNSQDVASVLSLTPEPEENLDTQFPPLPCPSVLSELFGLFDRKVRPVFPGLFNDDAPTEPILLFAMLSNACRFHPNLSCLSEQFFERAERLLLQILSQEPSLTKIRTMVLLIRHVGFVNCRLDLARLLGTICFGQAKEISLNALAKKELFEMDQLLSLLCGSKPNFDETFILDVPKNSLFVLLHRILNYRQWLQSPRNVMEAHAHAEALNSQLDAWYNQLPPGIQKLDQDLYITNVDNVLDANGKFKPDVDQDFIAKSLVFFYTLRVLLFSPLTCSIESALFGQVSILQMELEMSQASEANIRQLFAACRHEAALLDALTDVQTQFASMGSNIFFTGLVYGLTVKTMVEHSLQAKVLLPSSIYHLTRHAAILKDLASNWVAYKASSTAIWSLVGSLQVLEVYNQGFYF